MEPEVRFARIEALLQAMTERQNHADVRFNESFEKSRQRAEAAERRAAQRMEKFELRMG